MTTPGVRASLHWNTQQGWWCLWIRTMFPLGRQKTVQSEEIVGANVSVFCSWKGWSSQSFPYDSTIEVSVFCRSFCSPSLENLGNNNAEKKPICDWDVNSLMVGPVVIVSHGSEVRFNQVEVGSLLQKHRVPFLFTSGGRFLASTVGCFSRWSK